MSYITEVFSIFLRLIRFLTILSFIHLPGLSHGLPPGHPGDVEWKKENEHQKDADYQINRRYYVNNGDHDEYQRYYPPPTGKR